MKNALIRAGRTFLQAFLGYFAANLVAVTVNGTNDFNFLKNALIGLGVSGVAAGIAAVMNLPIFVDKGGENDGND